MSKSDNLKQLRDNLLKFDRELRSDLSTLQGYLESLESKLTAATGLNDVHIIKAETDRIIRKLSAYTQVMSRAEIRYETTDITFSTKAFSEELLKFLRREFPGVMINVDMDSRIPVMVTGDRDFITDVVYGFVALFSTNKCRACNVSFNLSQVVDDVHFIDVAVEAIGTKLSMELVLHMINGTHEQSQLTRMSSPLVFDWAVKLLEIKRLSPEIDSRDDESLVVTVYDQWSAAKAKEHAKPRLNDGLTKALHILIVEDNPLNQLVVRMMIENMSWTCDVADDGLQGINVFDPDRHDCIIMDIEMPVMDGIEATKSIRIAHGMRTPIIALTADAMHGNRTDFQDIGLDGFLVKPVKKDVLEERIRQAIMQKQS